MTLGQIIKAYRETNSMSMDDFSKASKISKGTYHSSKIISIQKQENRLFRLFNL